MTDFDTYPSLMMLATALFGISLLAALIPLVVALTPSSDKEEQ